MSARTPTGDLFVQRPIHDWTAGHSGDPSESSTPDDDVRCCAFALLGQPDAIQGEMQLECEYRAYGLSPSDSNYGEGLREKLQGRARRWRLLSRPSYEAINMGWFGFGRLYYWITDDDLAARRFYRAIAATQR